MHCFFFNDTATTEIYTLSLHDALPILYGHVLISSRAKVYGRVRRAVVAPARERHIGWTPSLRTRIRVRCRSEEHTSELQSRQYLVCRLLLEKKKKIKYAHYVITVPFYL